MSVELPANTTTTFEIVTLLGGTGNMLVEQGIISAEDARTMDLFTRGDMAKIIYEIRAHKLI